MKSKKKPQIVIEEISTEREIAEIQLEKLKRISRDRLLSFEEVKIFDLLTKNLLLLKGQATTVVTTARKVTEAKEISTKDLLKLTEAFGKEPDKSTLTVLDIENESDKDH